MQSLLSKPRHGVIDRARRWRRSLRCSLSRPSRPGVHRGWDPCAESVESTASVKRPPDRSPGTPSISEYPRRLRSSRRPMVMPTPRLRRGRDVSSASSSPRVLSHRRLDPNRRGLSPTHAPSRAQLTDFCNQTRPASTPNEASEPRPPPRRSPFGSAFHGGWRFSPPIARWKDRQPGVPRLGPRASALPGSLRSFPGRVARPKNFTPASSAWTPLVARRCPTGAETPTERILIGPVDRLA